MNFILSRDRVYSSTMGHSIDFKKGVPTFVPPALYAEVQAIGAIPEEELPEPIAPVSSEPTDPNKRAEEILAGIEALVERNAREDFAASGAPHVRALNVILGWKPTPQERDQLWARYQVDRQG